MEVFRGGVSRFQQLAFKMFCKIMTTGWEGGGTSLTYSAYSGPDHG